ncbi:MAG: sulfurtransferase TusA family protein [Rhizobiaceae bacterium]|nr:sulfurtransferase TusA family protein [Rhizobiaceae bacterium]
MRYAFISQGQTGAQPLEDTIPILDLRGLKCPLPVLKAKKAMKSLEQGSRIWLETTDPLAVIDIPAFCSEDSHKLVQTTKADGFDRFLIEHG